MFGSPGDCTNALWVWEVLKSGLVPGNYKNKIKNTACMIILPHT